MSEVDIQKKSVDVVRRPAEVKVNQKRHSKSLPNAICAYDDQNSKSDASFVHLHIGALRFPARSAHSPDDQSIHDNDREQRHQKVHCQHEDKILRFFSPFIKTSIKIVDGNNFCLQESRNSQNVTSKWFNLAQLLILI